MARTTVTCLVWSPRHGRVFSASIDNEGGGDLISEWDMSTERVVRRLHGHTGTVTALALVSHETMLCSGSDDCTLRMWDTLSGKHLGTHPLRIGEFVGAIAVANAAPTNLFNESILVGLHTGCIVAVDATTGQALGRMSGHRGSIWS